MLELNPFVPFFGPAYAPPYDSPLEEAQAWSMDNYLHNKVKVYKQFPVDTIYGRSRLDFVLESELGRIGIECDGAAYHDEAKDILRDAAILGSGRVREIVRFRGKDTWPCMADCLAVLSRMHPRLFSKSGRINLATLASPSAYEVELNRHDMDIVFFVPDPYSPLPEPHGDPDLGMDPEPDATKEIRISWRRWEGTAGQRSYWQETYDRLLKEGTERQVVSLR